MSKLTLALLSTLTLSACAGASERRLGLPASEVAELRCYDSGFALVPLGFQRTLGFQKLDGESLRSSSMSSPPRVIEVLPGTHEVVVSYSYWLEGSKGTPGEETLTIKVAAGDLVEFDLDLTGGPHVISTTTRPVELHSLAGR